MFAVEPKCLAEATWRRKGLLVHVVLVCHGRKCLVGVMASWAGVWQGLLTPWQIRRHRGQAGVKADRTFKARLLVTHFSWLAPTGLASQTLPQLETSVHTRSPWETFPKHDTTCLLTNFGWLHGVIPLPCSCGFPLNVCTAKQNLVNVIHSFCNKYKDYGRVNPRPHPCISQHRCLSPIGLLCCF